MENKKVLFLINKLGVGGAERVFIKDSNFLSRESVQIFFAFLYGSEDDQVLLKDVEITKEKIFYSYFKKFFDVKAFFRLSDFIKKNKIKVVYSTLDESNIIARLLKLFNPKIDVVIREANVADPKPFSFKVLDVIFNLFVKKIICVSEEVRLSLLKYQPFFKSKMEVLMNGVIIPKNSKDYKIQDRDKVKILNVGSLTKKKGQVFLIEACSIVQKERPDSFTLNIFGDGVLKNDLNKKVLELGLDKTVTINSPVSQEKLSEVYLASDLFVLSSLYEGCPNVLLEAMAHGLASISTKVSGANDIVVDNESGILVPISDSRELAAAIIHFIDDRGILSEFGKKGRQIILDKFSIEVHIKKLKQFLL